MPIMSNVLETRRIAVPPTCLAIACAWLALGWARAGQAQTAPCPENGPCASAPTLPIVPLKEPRPAQGTAPEQRWNVLREGRDAAPTASFIDTLRGNDAAIQVVVGQGRMLALKADLADREGRLGSVAVGDPNVLDVQIAEKHPRMIRLLGRRAGITDLSILTADGETCSYEVQVLFDLEPLRAALRQAFPGAQLRLGQFRDRLVIEGQARSPAQIGAILRFVEGELAMSETAGDASLGPGPQTSGASAPQGPGPQAPPSNGQSAPGSRAAHGRVRIVNLMRVPGVHQVMLQVRLAELNRTALRQVGADILAVAPNSGNLYGTNIASGTVGALGLLGLGGLSGTASGGALPLAKATTGFGIFPSSDFEILLTALRQNSLLSIMAEPNLMAMNGHQASFLAGGEFPVPVPQSGGGAANIVTVQWKNFGVQLNFVPYIQDDESIRLAVTPEVSTIDFALGTTLVAGGDPVPGLNTRRATTTVELREGQTLAIAGLLQVTLDANTARIPGLGDLPYIGPLFSKTSHQRTEKELLVLVTPRLVAPLEADQVPDLPGADLRDPCDWEFYLKNHIVGQVDPSHRSTANWDQSLRCKRAIKLEKDCVSGPVGFSE